MLTGCTRLRSPSRVPLSTSTPAQNAFERKEEWSRRFEALDESRSVLPDEPVEQLRRQMPRVLRQERSLHPLDDIAGFLQHMRIDHQPDFLVGKCKPVE